MNTLSAQPVQILDSVSKLKPTAGPFKIRNSRYKKINRKEKKQTVDVEKSLWDFLETFLSSLYHEEFLYLMG